MHEDFKDLRILLIEDNPGDRALVTEYLVETLEIDEIITAATFQEAEEIILSGNKISVILLDLSLPDKMGDILIKEMLAISKDLPIIILTGLNERSFGVKYLESGISDYLMKDDISPQMLLKSIIYTLQRKKITEKLKESETRYVSLFKFNPLPMWVYETNSLKIVDVNEAALKTYEYNYEEFRNITITDLRPDSELELLNKALKKINGEKKINNPGIFKHKTKLGNLIDVNITSTTIDFNEKNCRLVVAEDTSEKNRLANELNRLSYIAKCTNDAVMIIGKDCKIEWVNDAFKTLTGFSDNELIGRTEWEIFQGDKNYKTQSEYVNEKISRGEFYEYEALKHAKDGSTFWVDVQGMPLYDKNRNFTSYFVIEKDITDKKLSIDKLIDAEKRIRAFAGQTNSLLEEERARIAREIHDEIGQQFAGLKMSLSSIVKSYSLPDDLKNTIETIGADLHKSMQSIRIFANELRPAVLDKLGLLAAIKWLLMQFEDKTGISTSFICNSSKIITYEGSWEINVFRICQEALTNIAKHAEASAAEINIQYTNDILLLKIIDNGKGIKHGPLADPTSMGLLNMQERAKLIGAELIISSSDDKGTVVALISKLNERKNINRR